METEVQRHLDANPMITSHAPCTPYVTLVETHHSIFEEDKDETETHTTQHHRLWGGDIPIFSFEPKRPCIVLSILFCFLFLCLYPTIP